MTKEKGYITGSSHVSMRDAIENALKSAGHYLRFEVIETISSQSQDNDRHYQAMLAIVTE